jgi:hypothetical protein
MRKKIELERLQIIFFIVGVIMIIVGLVMIILWQQGFVQLKWLQCPDYDVLFA